jgi:hypothetical protein
MRCLALLSFLGLCSNSDQLLVAHKSSAIVDQPLLNMSSTNATNSTQNDASTAAQNIAHEANSTPSTAHDSTSTSSSSSAPNAVQTLTRDIEAQLEIHESSEAESKGKSSHYDEPLNPVNRLIRGVNVGGWLVLEPWITPSLFNPFLSA